MSLIEFFKQEDPSRWHTNVGVIKFLDNMWEAQFQYKYRKNEKLESHKKYPKLHKLHPIYKKCHDALTVYNLIVQAAEYALSQASLQAFQKFFQLFYSFSFGMTMVPIAVDKMLAFSSQVYAHGLYCVEPKLLVNVDAFEHISIQSISHLRFNINQSLENYEMCLRLLISLRARYNSIHLHKKNYFALNYLVAKDASRVFQLKTHNCARIIQRHWRRSICDPTYSLCRGRLLREFNELSL